MDKKCIWASRQSDPIPPPPKKKKMDVSDEVDEMLVRNLNNLCTRTPNEDGLFCKSVAATLQRFNFQQKALAKVRIQT